MRGAASTALVIGGTGMLAKATRWLAVRHARTLLVARHASCFAGDDPAYDALDLDWSQSDFAQQVAARLVELPPVATSLIWLHDPERLLADIAALLGTGRTIVVLGSMDGNPMIPESAAGMTTVRLGAVSSGSGRRWLTNEEIAHTVIAALEDGRSRIVGELVTTSSG